MTNKKYFKIAFTIILTFSAIIMMSFVADSMHEFLGDWHCNGAGCHSGSGAHDATWHWGWRHWMFFTCGFCLFILNVVRVIIIADEK